MTNQLLRAPSHEAAASSFKGRIDKQATVFVMAAFHQKKALVDQISKNASPFQYSCMLTGTTASFPRIALIEMIFLLVGPHKPVERLFRIGRSLRA